MQNDGNDGVERRRGRVRLRRAAIALVVGLILGVALGLATAAHLVSRGTARPLPPVPAGLYAGAEIPGLPGIRSWADDLPPGFAEQLPGLIGQWLLHKAGAIAAGRGLELNVLGLSGGGENGAFGAGLLVGWTRHGDRPAFDLVTGISTGALIAPFAFLGPDWDDELETAFTTIESEDIWHLRLPAALLGEASIAEGDRLRATIEHHATAAMLAAIGEQHRRGRRLILVTTNLDAGRPVAWDIGALAVSGHPDALRLFHDIIQASAAIPDVFPPVFFEVEAGGARHAELHVDGSVTAEIVGYPPQIHGGMLEGVLDIAVTRTVWLVRNGTLGTVYAPVEPGLFDVFERSMRTLIASQAVGDLYRIYAIAQRDDAAFRLAAIPSCFRREGDAAPFDGDHMRRLFELARRLGELGYPWDHAPPGMEGRDGPGWADPGLCEA